MANAMLGRIHQSGPLPRLKPASLAQVRHGIEIYKHHIRRYIPQFVPFYPLGMPVLTRPDLPAALGMRAGEKQFLAVWRRSGPEGVHIASRAAGFHLLYPRDLGIVAIQDSDGTTVRFPSPNMACILST